MDTPSGTLFPFGLNFPSNCSSAPSQLSQILPDKGGWLGTENMDFEGQWLQNIRYICQALPFNCCVALDKLLYQSESRSPTCKINTIIPHSKGGHKDYMK